LIASECPGESADEILMRGQHFQAERSVSDIVVPVGSGAMAMAWNGLLDLLRDSQTGLNEERCNFVVRVHIKRLRARRESASRGS
jgi:hypothetical protein